jgi:hypothetical protein
VQRRRPGTTVPDAILRGVPNHELSFTSGHAIITFAIAGLLVLVLVLPRRWGGRVRAGNLQRAGAGVPGRAQAAGCGRRAAIGLAIAAVLDMVLDVARDRGRRPPRKNSRAREDRAT